MMTSTAMPTAEQHGSPVFDGAFVPGETRSERFRSVNVGDFEPVTGREHEWKLSPVAAFAGPHWRPLDGSRVEIETTDAAGVDVAWIAPRRPRRSHRSPRSASANAWSNFGEALLITVTGEDEKVAAVTCHGLGDTPRAAYTVIEAAPNSRALVVLRGTGAARLSENVEIVVGEGALAHGRLAPGVGRRGGSPGEPLRPPPGATRSSSTSSSRSAARSCG